MMFGCVAQMMAASFDCTKAATPQEKTICADPELSRVDEQLATAYQTLLAQLSPNAAMEVRHDERDWLHWIPQACPDYAAQEADEFVACLLDEYSAQTATLKTGLQRINGVPFFRRVRVKAVPNNENPIPGAKRFDFLTERIDWPEIDRPTLLQATWNTAVRAELVEQQQIDTVVRVSILIKSANQYFISLSMEGSTYGYGAAHPNEEVKSFDWWLRLRRRLKVEDVFRPGSGWETALGDLCRLRLNAAGKPAYLYDDQTLRPAVAGVIKDVDDWSLDSRGLTIEFPEYSVAARSAGSFSTSVSWSELRPYLASQFDPATLPQSINPRRASR